MIVATTFVYSRPSAFTLKHFEDMNFKTKNSQCFFFVLIINEIAGSCVTPWGKSGECVNIVDCSEMLMMFNRKLLAPMSEKILQQARCEIDGIDYKVCCETINSRSTDNKIHAEKVAKVEGNGSDGNCITPSGQRGNCVNIKQCERAMKILQKVPLTEANRKFLRGSQCGLEDRTPKVCCEIERRDSQRSVGASCLTPWGKMGECIDVDDCEDMRMILRQNPLPPMHEKLLENARCERENSKSKVCCETKNLGTEVPTVLNEELLRKREDSRLPGDLCGPIPESRIVGGNDTTIYEFPWMALLGYSIGRRGIDFRCGGTLINEEYVLTAAHCLTGLPTHMKLVKIRIGEYNLETERDCDNDENCAGKYQEFLIDSVKPHENYSKRSYENDIGLIKLNGIVDFRPGNIRPICLPLDPTTFTANPRIPRNGIVTGWGATEFGTKSKILQKVTLPILHEDICKKAYERNKFVRISSEQICAGGAKDMDSCSGDSGGPLQAVGMYGNRPSFIQYGIVSYGAQTCGLEGIPGVYTKVSHHVRWILDNMKD